MSTAIPELRTAPAFCEAVSGILALLLGEGDGYLELDARTEGGIGHQVLRVSAVERGWIPEGLLTLLEGREDWHVRVSPAVRDGGRPVRLQALFARWAIPPVFDGSEWRIPEDQVAEVGRRLQSFPCAPSAVIDGAREVVALWRLEEPLPLRSEDELARAVTLQARLAAALRASTDVLQQVSPRSQIAQLGDRPIVQELEAYHPEAFLPLCGRVREMGTRGEAFTVEIPMFESNHSYPLDELERGMENPA